MDIGEILVTSWKITWKHKVLWLFGILVTFSQVFNIGNNIFRIVTQSDVLSTDALRGLFRVLDVESPVFWIDLVLFSCGMMFVLLLLSSLGQIGMIKGIALADSNENSVLSFGGIARTIKTYFWRVFGLSLALGFGTLILIVIIYAVMLGAIFGGVFLARDSGPSGVIPMLLIATICFLPLMCVFMIVSWAVGTVVMFATIAIINDDLGIGAAFVRSFHFVKKHFWQILLVIVLVAAVGGIVGVIMTFPVLFTSFIPLLALSGPKISGPIVWMSVLCLVAYTPVLVILNAIYSVYMHAIWTLTYRRLTTLDEAALAPDSVVGDNSNPDE